MNYENTCYIKSINELFALYRNINPGGTSSNSILSTNNSSTTILSSGSSFIGTEETVSNYNYIMIYINSNINSSNNGVIVEFANSTGNYFIKREFTYKSTELFNIQIPILGKYFRLTYVNSSSNQTNFTLVTTLMSSPKMTNGHGLFDAFGRLRVSEVKTLIDVTHTVDKHSIMVDEKTNGSGTSTHNSNSSCIITSVTNNSDYVIRQSRKYCIYQPGKSLLIKLTGILNLNNNSALSTSRIGYYDDDNGFFFEYSNQILKICKRTKVTGSIVNNYVNQSDWNLNPLNDKSFGYILDPSKVQIYFMDLQWLGVGKVRLGVVHNGEFVYVHEFVHANIETDVYITSANLPIRHELISSGGQAQAKLICSTVISEGGYDPIGMTFSAGRGTTAITVNNIASGIETPIVALKLVSSRCRTMVLPTSISILNTQNANMIYYLRLYRSPTQEPIYTPPSTSATWNTITNSAIQYSINTARVRNQSDSIVVSQGYFTSKADYNIDVGDIFNSFLQLTANIDAVSDILVLSCISLGNDNQDTYGSIQWREIY